jgi:hypothetical protein
MAGTIVVLALSAVPSGCGQGSGFTVGAHAALPQLEDSGGGILTSPKIVSVTFAANLYENAVSPDAATLLADLLDFDDTITNTDWWTTVSKDYCDPQLGCIGPGHAGAHVAVTAPPAGDGTRTCGVQPCYTDSTSGGPTSLQTYISGLFSDGTLPAPDAQSVYLFYFPESVTINLDGALSCQIFGGYHGSLTVGSLDVPYAIIPICEPQVTAPGTAELTLEQTATLTASHEIIEAVTDPHASKLPPAGANPTLNLGWALVDAASQAWTIVAGGEVADLCVDILGMGQDRWTQGSYTVQRIWSNSSAAASHDPCVPIPPGQVYFNAGPATVSDDQLAVPVGTSGTLDVAAFSDAPTDAWQVFALDVGTNPTTGQPLNLLLFSADSRNTQSMNNGASISVDVTLTGAPPPFPGQPTGTPTAEPYLIVSAGDKIVHVWPGAIINP